MYLCIDIYKNGRYICSINDVKNKIMEKEFIVKTKSGFEFPITVRVENSGNYCHVRYFAGNSTMELQEKNTAANSPAVFIDSYYYKEAKAHLEQFIPAVKGMKKANFIIAITPDEYSRLISEILPFTMPHIEAAAKAKAEREALEAAQPRVYVRWDFLDCGDYSTNQERAILECREPLPDEPQTLKVVRTVAQLWNRRIGEYAEEWQAMQGAIRTVSNKGGLMVVSKEEAMKWKARAEEADRKDQEAKAEKEAAAKALQEAAEKEYAAKFEEAKRTGNPVKLSSFFLSGSDIPRKYRDEDSDMGHLVTYAMPDGTTKESFHHAY